MEKAAIQSRIPSLRSLLDPQWRYSRAVKLVDSGIKFFITEKDALVVELTRFIEAWRETTEAEQERLETTFQDIYWAYDIFTREYRGPRFHIEALVIAGMETEEIANYLGLPTSVITTYELCFFDVRQHLDKPGAIKTYIGSKIRDRGNRDLDPDPFWKQVALSCGTNAVMALWNDGALEKSDINKLDDIFTSQIRRQAIKALNVRDINQFNAHEVIEEYLETKRTEFEVQKSMPSGGSGENADVKQFVASILSSIQFCLAPIDNTGVSSVEVTTALAHAPELLQRLQNAQKRETNEHGEIRKSSE